MKGHKINYSDDQLAFVKDNCQLTRRELTQRFNERYGMNLAISNIAGLCKRNGWLTGRTGRYEKGHTPHPNSGLNKPNKTSFKIGDVPSNIKPIGHERIDKDGYTWIKTTQKDPYTPAKTRYMLKHQYIWEKHNGPRPKKTIVTFIDGDKKNCSIENLELISMAEHIQRIRLGFHKMPAELHDNVRALAKLETARFEKIKTTGQG